MSQDDDQPQTEEDVTLPVEGDLVISLDAPEARIQVSVPSHADPNLLSRLLDMAVEAVAKLKTHVQ